MQDSIAYTLTSNQPFEVVVALLEKLVAENKFRVLHVHDVQATLAEKGFERGPLKIIEVCNSGFAHKALQKDINVALFMPCKFTVHTEGGKTIISLGRPSIIGQMLPGSGLEELAADVEKTLKKVMEAAV
jgi:uncharacterized protein (DUF302 family)